MFFLLLFILMYMMSHCHFIVRFPEDDSSWNQKYLEKYGIFLSTFHPKFKRSIRRLERIKDRIRKHEVFVLSNQAYLKENIYIYYKGTRLPHTSLSSVLTTCLEHRLIKSKKTASSWQRKEAEGTPQKQLLTLTTPMTSRFWQIHPTKPNHFCIVWNKRPRALASMSMHTKLNACALIKQAIFPH